MRSSNRCSWFMRPRHLRPNSDQYSFIQFNTIICTGMQKYCRILQNTSASIYFSGVVFKCKKQHLSSLPFFHISTIQNWFYHIRCICWNMLLLFRRSVSWVVRCVCVCPVRIISIVYKESLFSYLIFSPTVSPNPCPWVLTIRHAPGRGEPKSLK